MQPPGARACAFSPHRSPRRVRRRRDARERDGDGDGENIPRGHAQIADAKCVARRRVGVVSRGDVLRVVLYEAKNVGAELKGVSR